MKIAIVGSRSFNDYQYFQQMLKWFTFSYIISGGAKGADTLAKRYAIEHGIPFKEHLPNWDRDGKSAGFIRNQLIVNDCDELIAFWDKTSRGTKHSINIAENAGKPVHIFWPDIEENIGT